ncbi:hypothetical protein [Aquamicrobium sp. LC103]|uniref:hypothetical protein n=1 Tax=Aquamicrobium sp. LC103 TaxID=1120658 RepID=UPI0010C9F390|nr:hypothetical protein [Aquamicrobium sp. LC103]TKT82422.1 hypothetical protein XW59_000170 [Aquamicrobium sp. LC103]
MNTHEFAAAGISVTVDLSVGHIARLSIEHGGRTLVPLHRAPWADESDADLPEGPAPNVARLSGDFFCAPFSRNDVEAAPTHGWSANGAWEPVESAAVEGGWRARFRLERPVMGAVLEKTMTLRDGHPFLYQEHRFHGGGGEVPVAHHTMVRMEEGGTLAFSPKKCALTPETALEADPARGRSLLAYPARSERLERVAMAGGGFADLGRYPIGEAHEDFVTLVEAADAGIGFAACARHAEADLVLVLKRPAELPVTMLWYSNGGRRYAPWNGRHVGVLGIEDGCSAVGHRASIGDNPVRREGVATALRLVPDGSVAVRQVIGATAPDKRKPPVSIVPAGGCLILTFEDGHREALPFDDEFLA